MDIQQSEKLDLMITRAFDNAIANAKNVTTYDHWSKNPALFSLYKPDGSPMKQKGNMEGIPVSHPVKSNADSKTDKNSSSGDNRILRKNESSEHSINWETHKGRKYAYSDYTLKFFSENKEKIKKTALKHEVPPIALAMAIGDELETRREQLKGFYNKGKDGFANNLLSPDKLDFGASNIRMKTAREIRDEKGWKMDDRTLQKYILSDEGTIHIGALALKKVKDKMEPALKTGEIPDYEYFQHLVEGYREGPEIRIKRRLDKEKEAMNKGMIHDQPMKTGVPAERSLFRSQQIKWIFNDEDKNFYEQKGLWSNREKYPNLGEREKQSKEGSDEARERLDILQAPEKRNTRQVAGIRGNTLLGVFMMSHGMSPTPKPGMGMNFLPPTQDILHDAAIAESKRDLEQNEQEKAALKNRIEVEEDAE